MTLASRAKGPPQDQTAGIATRLVSAVVDLFVVLMINLMLLLAWATFHYLVGVREFAFTSLSPAASAYVIGCVAIVYLTSGWTGTGRTVGTQLTGLRVVSRSGGRLTAGRAIVRAILSIAFPFGLLWIPFSRNSLSLQDLLVSSKVVYDISYRGPTSR